MATFGVAGKDVNRWVKIPDAWRSRPSRREMSSSTRLLANALSRIRNGSSETNMPAPNSMT